MINVYITFCKSKNKNMKKLKVIVVLVMFAMISYAGLSQKVKNFQGSPIKIESEKQVSFFYSTLSEGELHLIINLWFLVPLLVSVSCMILMQKLRKTDTCINLVFYPISFYVGLIVHIFLIKIIQSYDSPLTFWTAFASVFIFGGAGFFFPFNFSSTYNRIEKILAWIYYAFMIVVCLFIYLHAVVDKNSILIKLWRCVRVFFACQIL